MRRIKTAGVDGKASLSFEERFALSEQLKQSVFTWKHQKLREIPIPKKDGQTRILKVPTIADRTWQCLVKYALEPACAWQLSTLGVMGSEQGARRKTRKSSCLTTYAPPAME